MRSRSESSRAWVLVLVLGLAPLWACAGNKVPPGSALKILTEEADQDADVFVDGQYVGTVGEIQGTPAGDVLLAPGVHRVEVRKSGRYPVQRTVEVADDPPPTTEVQAELLEEPP